MKVRESSSLELLEGKSPPIPSRLPPPRDHPMVVSKSGEVISRYGDDYIDYSLYAGVPLRISLINTHRTKYKLNCHHLELLRVLVAYYQFEYHQALVPTTISVKIHEVRRVMHFCEEHGVLFDELHRFPRIIEEFYEWIRNDHVSERVLLILTDIYGSRKEIGFYGLDAESLKLIGVLLGRSSPQAQTPYIPERIWLYQIDRIEYFLDRFIARKKSIQRMFLKMLKAYINNLGSVEKACRAGKLKHRSPHSAYNVSGAVKLGTFPEFSKKYGVAELMDELLFSSSSHEPSITAGGKPFGRYLNSISFIAQIMLINFSGMRISEAASLRVSCYEEDEGFSGGKVSFLRGETKKTVEDNSALWITSEIAKKAIEALTVISALRMRVIKLDSRIRVEEYDMNNPYLVVYSVEPWVPSKIEIAERDINIRSWPPYNLWQEKCPGLFDLEKIKITPEDLEEALEATPSLDPEKYAIGKIWPFAYHQLRRTLLVNAARSDLVSIYSSQYQAKHQYQTMSTYYGRGFSGLALNKDIEAEFVEEVYRQLVKVAEDLTSEEYFSPLKESHKAALISFIGEKDFKALLKMAKNGDFSIRRTLLGICLHKGICSFGAIDNIVNCNSCHEALIKKGNRPKLERFLGVVEGLLANIDENSPRYESLCKQRQVAIEIIEAINV